jgi:hypothetical protein
VTIDMVALEPPYSPLGLPVTSTTTGNVDTPDDVEANRPIEPTVPYTGVVEPDTVMVAWSPTLSWLTWVLSTVPLTMYEPVETTVIWAVDEPVLDEDEDELLPADPVDELAAPANELAPDDPVEVDAVAPLDPEVELEPDTCWPTVRLTAATVPSMVDVNVASAKEVWALATWVWAESTLAWSDAIWADEAPSAWSEDSWA